MHGADDGGRGINIAVCSGGDRRGKRKHTTQHEQSKRARITDTAEAALRVREINPSFAWASI